MRRRDRQRSIAAPRRSKHWAPEEEGRKEREREGQGEHGATHRRDSSKPTQKKQREGSSCSRGGGGRHGREGRGVGLLNGYCRSPYRSLTLLTFVASFRALVASIRGCLSAYRFVCACVVVWLCVCVCNTVWLGATPFLFTAALVALTRTGAAEDKIGRAHV